MDDIMNPATFNSLIARLEEFEDKVSITTDAPDESESDELYDLQETILSLV